MGSYLKFTAQFTDNTTRNITIGEIESTAINPTALKTKIQNFNDAATRATAYPAFDNAFVSESGAAFKKISAAEIITTSKTYFDVT